MTQAFTAVGISLIDYRLYRVYAYHLFALAIALLVIVLLIGRGGADDDYGSRRWIYFGLFDLQASEVAKLAVLVALAGLYPASLRRPTKLLRPALTGLHRLHSGHIGDYAAWLVFGTTVLAGLLATG